MSGKALDLFSGDQNCFLGFLTRTAAFPGRLWGIYFEKVGILKESGFQTAVPVRLSYLSNAQLTLFAGLTPSRGMDSLRRRLRLLSGVGDYQVGFENTRAKNATG